MGMTSKQLALDAAVRTVAPIHGVTFGLDGQSVTAVQYNNATSQQQLNAQAVIGNFDWSDAAQAQRDRLSARAQALADLAGSGLANPALLRALMLVMLDEINNIRANFVPPQTARTVNQLRTAIQNKINTGSAD